MIRSAKTLFVKIVSVQWRLKNVTIFEVVLVTYSIIHKCIPMGYIWFRQMMLFVFKPLLP